MYKISHFSLAFVLLQLCACGAEPGNDPSSEADVAPAASSNAPLLGSDACKNTEITVKNSFFYDGRQRGINVDFVEYRSADEGRWYTQSLGDEYIEYGHEHTWQNKDLQHAEGDLLTKWRVHFRYDESDGDESDRVYEEIDTPDDICRADDNYTLTVN